MGTSRADILRKRPLRLILLVGLALRILAAFNSPGYLMHDDHFLVVETGASWAVGEDYNNWMPWSQRANGIENPTPHQANLAYAGIVSGYFRVCNALGFVDPAQQMLLLRLLHGLFSLLIVALGFRIAEKLGGERPARWTGWALAAFGLFPLLGVRQLVEMVCIPPLMWSAWVVLRSERRTWKTWALAGIGIGIATALRYQCGVFGLGWVIALLVHERKWQQAVLNSAIMGCAALLTFTLGQLQDVFIWGEPFAQLRAYIEYNSTHAGAYPQGFLAPVRLGGLGTADPPLFAGLGHWHSTRSQTPRAPRHSTPRLLPLPQRFSQQTRALHPSCRAVYCYRREHRLACLYRGLAILATLEPITSQFDCGWFGA